AVTLSSNGTAPLHITGVSVSGDFAETNDCGKGVAAGSTCALNVTFTPTASGTRTGTLTINDNAGGSPQTVSLVGTATSSGGPVVSLSPSSLSFGNQPVGATSTPQNVTLTNTGTCIAPMATQNPTSLSFGNQSVGTTSGPKAIQLKNTGNSTLTISSIAISGTNATDFAQTNNCPGSLAPGAQCNINVNFSPRD